MSNAAAAIPEDAGLRSGLITERENLVRHVEQAEQKLANANERYEDEFDSLWLAQAKKFRGELDAAKQRLSKFDAARQREAEVRGSDEVSKLRDDLKKQAAEFEKALATFADTARKLQETALKHQRAASLRTGEPLLATSLGPKLEHRTIDVIGSRGDIKLQHYGERPSVAITEVI